jgi:hypothetical protein
MIRLLKRIVGLLVFAGIIFGGLEISLRTLPELIPLTLLKRFQKDLRLDIAQQRSLWNESLMWELKRDDGGPSLKLFKPHTEFTYNFGKDEKGITLMDDQGFCNPSRNPYDLSKIDVIAIGDSFTWCVVLNPEATWISQIGEISGLSVYNLGRGGIGPYDYLQILKHFGLPKKPDYVVMNIYEGNDLRDAMRYQDHIKAAQQGRVLYKSASDRGTQDIDIDSLLDYPVLRNSYSLNFTLAVIDKAYGVLRNVVLRISGGDAPEIVDFHYRFRFPDKTVEFNLQNADESEVIYAKKLKSGEVDFAAFEDALTQFVELANAHGFKPVVAYSPSAYTGYADYVEFNDPMLNTLMPWFSQAQRQFLSETADKLGYTFVDLAPAMQAAGHALREKELLYHPINVHFTMKGNRIVAETLAKVISAQQAGTAVKP